MRDLETERTIIRKFRIEDAEDIYNNIANIKKLEDCYNYNMHKNVEETRIIVASSIKEYELGEPVWAIEEKESGIVVGYIRTDEMSTKNKVCKLNFGIGMKWTEKGLLEEALMEVINYLVYEEDFNTIVSKFYDGHDLIKKVKTRVLKNIGMKQEATLRNRKINDKTGVSENLLIFSILKEEIEQRKNKEEIHVKAS